MKIKIFNSGSFDKTHTITNIGTTINTDIVAALVLPTFSLSTQLPTLLPVS